MATVSAVFAAALSLSLVSRAAVVESGALSRAMEQEFGARSAATRAVMGVVGERVSASGEVTTSATDAPGGGAPEVDTDELPEMPEFMREFLEGMLDEEEADEGEEAPEQAATPTSTRNASRFLAARGLPAGPVTIETGGGAYEVRLIDAASATHLNKAGLEELESAFVGAGVEAGRARSLAAEVIDYRDTDDFVTTRGAQRGAEREAYERRGLEIRNGDLTSVEELLYLPSMTADAYRLVAGRVTVLGDGKLHAPSVPEGVLRALPEMTREAADRILSLRASGRLDAESLAEALPAFGDELAGRFRFEPSPLIRVLVRRAEGAGPVYEGVAVVSGSAGVQWLEFGMSRWETAWE